MPFPISPSNGATTTINNVTYTYNNTNNTWTVGSSGVVGPTGPTGPAGTSGSTNARAFAYTFG